MKKSKITKEVPKVEKKDECCQGWAAFGVIMALISIGATIVFGVNYLCNIHPAQDECYENKNYISKVDSVIGDEVYYRAAKKYMWSFEVSDVSEGLSHTLDTFRDRYDTKVDCGNFEVLVLRDKISELQNSIGDIRQEVRYGRKSRK